MVSDDQKFRVNTNRVQCMSHGTCLQLNSLQQALFNPFTPKFLIWPLPPLNLDTSTAANGGASQKPKTEWQTVISSGSMLFAKVYVLVCRTVKRG